MNELMLRIVADGLIVPIVIIGAAALMLGVPAKERFHAYSRIIMAGLTALLFAKLVGAIYQPETMRPFEQLGVAAGASFLNNPGFPSDHTLLCMTITLAVWFETRYRKIAYLLFGLTLAVAIGRVAALVHTPLDVIGGIIIAGFGIPWYLQRETFKHTAAPARQKHKKPV